MQKNDRLGILVSSCDSYDDLWGPFFACIDKFWTDIPYPIYLNTETKVYDDSQNRCKVKTVNQRKAGEAWSKRMLNVLDRIEEEYVFLVLDDLFLCDKVDNAYFEQILDMMDKDPSIASFQLFGTVTRGEAPEAYTYEKELTYELIPEDGWKTRFTPTVWRKSVLQKWLRPWESIWGFEGCGSARAIRWKYPEKVYRVSAPLVYGYIRIKNCSAVVNGKWLKEPELLTFFEENDIPVDFSHRDWITVEEYRSVTMKTIMKRYTFGQIIVKSINRIRSIF